MKDPVHCSPGPDAAASPPPRLTLSQAEACYYQPYHQHLACQCPEQNMDRAFLALHMEYWVNTMGQKVISLLSCFWQHCCIERIYILPLSEWKIKIFSEGKLKAKLRAGWDSAKPHIIWCPDGLISLKWKLLSQFSLFLHWIWAELKRTFMSKSIFAVFIEPNNTTSRISTLIHYLDKNKKFSSACLWGKDSISTIL